MDYKIFEANGIEIKNIDGGAFNNFCAGGKSGIVAGVLDECKITSSSNTITVATGLLDIQGIRIKIISPKEFVLSGTPAVDINYQIIAKVIVREDESVLFDMFITETRTLTQDNFYKTESGIYEFELASFVYNSSGAITNIVAKEPFYAGVDISQATGSSEKSTMSQKAITEELNKLKALIEYEPIQITSFANNVNTVEIGSNVTSATFTWGINKTPTKLTFSNTQIASDSTSRTESFSKPTSHTSKTFSLKAEDEKGATDTKYSYIYFYNGIYYGVASIPETYDSAFIRGFEKSLQGSKSKTFIVTAGENQYIYYCLPTRFESVDEPIFNVGGFDGGFAKVETISFTNASGYTENYSIWRSDNANLGKTTVVVK